MKERHWLENSSRGSENGKSYAYAYFHILMIGD